ncbi:MAG TPA: hypothetical protein VMW12_03375 [Candidatus Dormibacteraeota bacterium]|nr:hypothetical protein [Candidatus Dormibacteraeota bacterium]
MDVEERLWKQHDSLAQASGEIVVLLGNADGLLYGVVALAVAAGGVFTIIRGDGLVAAAMVLPIFITLRGVRRSVAASRSRGEVEFLVRGGGEAALQMAINALGEHFAHNEWSLASKRSALRLAWNSWLILVGLGVIPPLLVVLQETMLK